MTKTVNEVKTENEYYREGYRDGFADGQEAAREEARKFFDMIQQQGGMPNPPQN